MIALIAKRKHFKKLLRVYLNSRMTTFLESGHVHKLEPLSIDSACSLLDQRASISLNKTEKKLIAELTGEIPLALKIV